MAVIPIAGIIYGSAAAVEVMAFIYDAWREKPDETLAKHLRAAKIQQVQRRTSESKLEEKIRARHAGHQVGRLEDLVGTKAGLDTGSIAPAELGIQGGGLSARDMPMVQQVAMRLGMDPADLVAKFDPTRSNMYVPPSRRGNRPSPRADQIAPPEAAGPAQLNPNTGFGG